MIITIKTKTKLEGGNERQKSKRKWEQFGDKEGLQKYDDEEEEEDRTYKKEWKR